MPKWKLVYQNRPDSPAKPNEIVIEADNRVDAVLNAFVRLAHSGTSIGMVVALPDSFSKNERTQISRRIGRSGLFSAGCTRVFSCNLCPAEDSNGESLQT